MTARAGVEPTTFRLKVIDSTKAPSSPTAVVVVAVVVVLLLLLLLFFKNNAGLRLMTSDQKIRNDGNISLREQIKLINLGSVLASLLSNTFMTS